MYKHVYSYIYIYIYIYLYIYTLSPKAACRFHESSYSANIMKLSVLGREDLDTLEVRMRVYGVGCRM